MKRKPICPNGCRIMWFGSTIQRLSMVRLYIRQNKKFKAIGWICPNCGSVILKQQKLKKMYMAEPYYPNSPQIIIDEHVS